MKTIADPACGTPPDVLQQENIDHLEAALAAFRDVAAALPKSPGV